MPTKINWFEIPSTDFDRAVNFYETVFENKLPRSEMGGPTMGLFDNADGESIGCVIHGEQFVPGDNGTVIYLDASPSIDAVIARIRPAGGRLLMEKMKLPAEHGYIAQFIDTEGNRLALHAMN